MKPIFGLNLKNDDDEEIGNSVGFTTLSLSPRRKRKNTTKLPRSLREPTKRRGFIGSFR